MPFLTPRNGAGRAFPYRVVAEHGADSPGASGAVATANGIGRSWTRGPNWGAPRGDVDVGSGLHLIGDLILDADFE